MNRHQEIEHEARQQFANANGWSFGRGFSLRALANNMMHGGWGGCSDSVGDHAEHYRKDRRAVALVAHNYPASSYEDCEQFYGRVLTGTESDLAPNTSDDHYGVSGIARKVGQWGLVTHVAPAGRAASWYYPNHSILIVVTRPGVEIIWPTPQQMVATAMSWAIDHERRHCAAHAKRLAA